MLVAVTISPVQQGEELLIDYGEHYWENIVVRERRLSRTPLRKSFSCPTFVCLEMSW